MLDPLIADLMAYIEAEHADTCYERDPVRFCQLKNIDRELGPRSLARARRSSEDRDIIFLGPHTYGSRELFDTAHEIVHILAKRGGYIALIKHHHASVPDMRLHIEQVVNHGTGRLLMPAPDLQVSRRTFGESPQAILHLAQLSGASEAAAMRRWTWQDVSEYRAAFIARGSYIEDATACRARLPFRRADRVPELHLSDEALNLLTLGGGRIMGTVA